MPRQMYVYFLRPIGRSGPVKIGCSHVPLDRLAFFMAWAPEPLEIAAVYPGDHRVEHRFHALFKEYWSHREWFRAAPEITAAIAAINAGAFDPETLPHRGVVNSHRVFTAEDRVAFSCRSRLGRLKWNSGLEEPANVAASYSKIFGTPEERDAAVALIEAYLADPIAYAKPMPYPWAKKKFAEFQKKRADKSAKKRTAA